MSDAVRAQAWRGTAAPVWWHRARRAYDRVTRSAGEISLPATLAAADGFGRLVYRLNPRYPPVAEVAALFSGTSRSPASISSRMCGMRYKNRALVSIMSRSGSRVLIPLLSAGSVETIRNIPQPAIAFTWHAGPAGWLAASLMRAGVPAFAIRRTARPPRWGIEVGSSWGPVEARARTFARAMTRLREGGLVVVAVDGEDLKTPLPAPCLGRLVPMARGPFALARLTGAPLVPLVARWTDRGQVEIVAGDAITQEEISLAGGDSETTAARLAARRMEGCLRASPHEIWFCMLRWLLAAPRA
jgi:hypothetical protein